MPSRLSASITAINTMLSSTASLATAAGSSVNSLKTSLGAAETSVRASAQRIAADVAAAKDEVDSGAESMLARLDSLRDLANGKLGETIALLEQQAAAGDGLAASVLDVINQVKEGAIDAQAAISAFDEFSIPFQGKMVMIKTLLAEILPSTGEVQRHLRELMEQLRADGVSVEELIERLGMQHNILARQFAEMVKNFRLGKVTLDALLRAAEQIRRALPGSETDKLIEELMQGLRSGEFQ